ncbi:MAG TPA: putative Se/S carrier-like protein [Longimicrobiaceae bacterium]|nr:putative Se/S carrier-like protein [Longimicrobiaceae bacterium]
MPERRIFTFDTTHHALWAEEIARERGVPAEAIPAPAAAHAKCSLALETLPGDVGRLSQALEDEGVAFALYSSSE